MSQKIYGSKDFFSVFSFVFTGIAVLLGLNIGVFYVFVKNPSWKWWFFIGLAILMWIGWRMWRTQKNMYYIFDKKTITIHLPNRKEFVLSRKDIESQDRIARLSLFSGWGVMYVPWKHEVYFTTSTSNILKLTMKDGRVIFLSPKIYP